MSEDRLHIANLGLSKRTYNLLAQAGLMYIEQLESATDEELLVIPGFGRGQLTSVRRKLLNREQREHKHTQDLPSLASGGEAVIEYMDGSMSIYPAYQGPLVFIDGGYGGYDAEAALLDPQQALALLAWLKQEEATLQQLVEKIGG